MSDIAFYTLREVDCAHPQVRADSQNGADLLTVYTGDTVEVGDSISLPIWTGSMLVGRVVIQHDARAKGLTIDGGD